MISCARIVPPDMTVAPASALPKGFSTRSAGIYDLEVKIFLILNVPSSWMISIVFIEFWLLEVADWAFLAMTAATFDI